MSPVINTNPLPSVYTGSSSFSSSITPGEWQKISDGNIRLAEQERIASVTLRGVINSVLEQTQQDIIKQRKVVNTEFNRRIREVTEAKLKLEKHLTEVGSPYHDTPNRCLLCPHKSICVLGSFCSILMKE